MLAARSADLIKGLEKELPNSLAIVTDMQNPKHISNMIKKTMDKYDRIDILINNAGQGMYGAVEKIDIEHYKKIMDLNCQVPKQLIIHYQKQNHTGPWAFHFPWLKRSQPLAVPLM